MPSRWFVAHLALPAFLVVSIGCGSNAPTGPSPSAGLGASSERRVDSVGGGQGQCGEAIGVPCPPPRTFELKVADDSTLSGECPELTCTVRSGTGRFEGLQGIGSVNLPGNGGNGTLSFALTVSGPSTGGQLFLIGASLPSFTTVLTPVPVSRCPTGLMEVITAAASLEHLGRSVMTVSTCSA